MEKYDSYVVVDNFCDSIVANCSTLDEAQEELSRNRFYSIYGCINNEYSDETML